MLGCFFRGRNALLNRLCHFQLNCEVVRQFLLKSNFMKIFNCAFGAPCRKKAGYSCGIMQIAAGLRLAFSAGLHCLRSAMHFAFSLDHI